MQFHQTRQDHTHISHPSLSQTCIPQRFIVVVVCGADARHHQGLGIPSQRRLEEAGQLGISIRNVLRPAVHESRDDVTEGREGQVDLGGLFQPVPCKERDIASRTSPPPLSCAKNTSGSETRRDSGLFVGEVKFQQSYQGLN